MPGSPAMTSTTFPSPGRSTRSAGRAGRRCPRQPGRRLRRRGHVRGIRGACALFEARKSGEGRRRRRDDGRCRRPDDVAALAACRRDMEPGAGTNRLDSGAHFYDVYETADGRYVSIGSIEPRFTPSCGGRSASPTRSGTGRTTPPPGQCSRRTWRPFSVHKRRAVVPRLRRGEGRRVLRPGALTGRGAADPHNAARGAFLTRDGVTFPAPAPRLSRTPAAAGWPPQAPGRTRPRSCGTGASVTTPSRNCNGQALPANPAPPVTADQ